MIHKITSQHFFLASLPIVFFEFTGPVSFAVEDGSFKDAVVAQPDSNSNSRDDDYWSLNNLKLVLSSNDLKDWSVELCSKADISITMQQSFYVGNMNTSVNRGMHQSTPHAGGSYYRPSDNSMVSRNN